jgi:hypothetical protein
LAVAISTDGRWLLTGSRDKTVRIWEVATETAVSTLQGHSEAISAVSCSQDGRHVLSAGGDGLRLWGVSWDLRHRAVADWDEAAGHYLVSFLTLHTPYCAALPSGNSCPPEALCLALSRRGKPTWTEEEFQGFLATLSHCGFGWLRPEAVRRELEKMAASWLWPPALPAETAADRVEVTCPNPQCLAPLHFPKSILAMLRRCQFCRSEFVVHPSGWIQLLACTGPDRSKKPS